MIIHRIRFENYRAYYGEVVFDFPIEDGRNVSIIFANNDIGKLVFSLAFCFAYTGIGTMITCRI